MAGMFLMCWLLPVLWHKSVLLSLGYLLGIEFFVIHAGVFIAVASIPVAVLLTIAYSGIAYGLSLGLSISPWLVFSGFALLLFDKIIVVLTGTADNMKRKKRQYYFWSRSLMYYLGGAIFVSIFRVPKLGFSF